ncbi:hypothetical protein ACKAMS_33260 [Rhodococcus sp. 5A-K4]
MTFVNDAPSLLPGTPDSTPELPPFQMTLIGQPPACTHPRTSVAVPAR